MSFLFNFVELLLMAVMTVDTLGFIVQSRKNPSSSNQRDYLRLCFTWVFFLIIRSLVCSSCTGYIGGLLNLLAFVAKIYVGLPLLHGSEKLYNSLIEQNAAKHYLETVVNIVKNKMGCCQAEESKKTE